MKTFLDEILADVRTELDATKARHPLAEIRRMIPDAPPVRPLPAALAERFCLIGEIKVRSPSVGPMRSENVAQAATAYQESPVVAAISVLTNNMHFGMSIEQLASTRSCGSKPVLRKDFIIEEYQMREARAFGADAVLLMANVLDPARLSGFYDLARELDMEALFEVHSARGDFRLASRCARRRNQQSKIQGRERICWTAGRLGNRFQSRLLCV